MNNKRSPIEQFLLIALLGFAAFTLSQQIFGNNKNKNTVPPRTAPALSKAFAGLEPGAAADKDAALLEVAKLQKEIEAAPTDEYSAWAHLRAGLLQQYVLRNATEAVEEYDVVINRNQHKPADAQALYQKGDLLWRQAEYGKSEPAGATTAGSTPGAAPAANSATPSTPATTPASSTTLDASQIKKLEEDSIKAFELVLARGRSDKTFLDNKIFVPGVQSFRGDPLDLPAKWEQLPFAELRGSLDTPDPRGILTRIDTYYARTPAFGFIDLYGIFDTVVKWFGAQPGYSYGLALLLLAIVTRTVMQPFIKKQYDSMKGMSVIAPEMKKIQEKYKGKSDPESQRKMMTEIRTLQKAHGVNPMGCGLSMLIQMPVFFFFVLPLINHYQARLELAGAHFGWIPSLARPDIPLLVLYAISMFVSVRLSSVPPTDEQQKQMQKMTTLMSPLFAIVLWSYPSAFILYWLAYNILSMVFQWRMMKKAEPEKNLVKTLMGTAQPVAALAGAPGSAPVAGALPARPRSEKSKPEKNEAAFETNVAALNATPDNGVASNGTAKSNAGKSGAGSGSQRARRRRR